MEDTEIGDLSTTVIENRRLDTTENVSSKSSKEQVETKSSASEKKSIAGVTEEVNKSNEYGASPVIPVIQTTSEKVEIIFQLNLKLLCIVFIFVATSLVLKTFCSYLFHFNCT